ncbi:hypothetical protein Mal52_13650 [Symmachiella dynata]|uniref:NACHT domain protein n=1 Tax=Symmachiella dynata TaxID=2527995 RepID=A0A517ZKC3_9PLAN|nr:hypothetical protein [Symmachiella dynata]QDU42896.1 hypothetical protein Mal52_13650 [Symmachiella dynata]
MEKKYKPDANAFESYFTGQFGLMNLSQLHRKRFKGLLSKTMLSSVKNGHEVTARTINVVAHVFRVPPANLVHPSDVARFLTDYPDGDKPRPDPDSSPNEGNEAARQISTTTGKSDADSCLSQVSTIETVIDFLERLVLNGFRENVVYLPPNLTPGDGNSSKPDARGAIDNLAHFCLPVRVIEQDDWQRLDHQRAAPLRSRSWNAAHVRNRIVSTSEDFCRIDGERQTQPQPLESVLASNRHVILRGEPGEGKTTSLFLHVVKQCRELAAGLCSGQFDHLSEECRIPLPLPLGKAAPTKEDESFCVVDRARDEALRIAYGQVEKAPHEVTEWIKEKVLRNEVDLCLDALDELDIRWHESLRKELVHCSGMGIFLTTRTSADDTNVIATDVCHRYHLVSFGPAQVREYIKRFFSQAEKRGEQLSRELRDQLRLSHGLQELAQLPLLLALLCQWLSARWQWQLTEIRRDIPKNRTTLLRDALHQLMERGDAKHRGMPVSQSPSERNRIKETVLRHVAWRFFAAGPLPIVKQDLIAVLEQHLEHSVWKGYAPPHNAEALLTEFLEDGVLVRQNRGIYRFVLRAFHEFCVAEWILFELRNCSRVFKTRHYVRRVCGNAMTWGRRDWPRSLQPIAEPGWSAIWLLVGEQLKGKEVALFFRAIRRYLNPIADPYAILLHVLKGAWPLDWPLNTSDEYPVMELGARVCGETESSWGAKAYVSRLIRLTKHYCFKDKVPYFLAMTRKERALACLIRIVRDNSIDVQIRYQCAQALGLSDSTEVRKDLLSVSYQIDDGTLRSICTESLVRLCRYGDDESIELLYTLLLHGGDTQANLQHTVDMLVEIDTVASVKAIKKAVAAAADGYVRYLCIHRLARLGHSEMADLLGRIDAEIRRQLNLGARGYVTLLKFVTLQLTRKMNERNTKTK